MRLFQPEIDFPHKTETDIERYKDELKKEIKTRTKKCERSIFIFDEMEKMTPHLVDELRPFLDFNDHIDGIDYRKNIFIFLCNSGGNLIAEETLRHFKRGKRRESIKLKELEKVTADAAFNHYGGLNNSSLILSGLVNYFLPFLPLERTHVEECIRKELRRLNITLNESIVSAVSDELDYFPENEKIFALMGCKRITKAITWHTTIS